MADRIKGLDVSDHQADWKPSPSYHFVFIKATEGQSWKAQKAAQHARRARDTGYVVGWYHFLWPSAKSGNPSTQAMWFLNNIPDLRVGDLLVCDWEPTKGGTPTRSDKNLFMAAVKKARGNRNKVGLYLNASMWNSSDKKAGDFLWVARYGADDGVAEKWQFWQFTDKPIDQNWGDFASRDVLRRWATPSLPKPPTPAPSPLPPSSPPGEGILGMTQSIYFRWDTDRPIKSSDGWVDLYINDKHHVSVTGENRTVTADATVRIAGLANKEWVEIAWRLVEIVKENGKDVTKVRHTRKPVTVIGIAHKQNASTTFNGGVPKNLRLRVAVRTNSQTAVVDEYEVQGWKE
jgi:hypothetical protein